MHKSRRLDNRGSNFPTIPFRAILARVDIAEGLVLGYFGSAGMAIATFIVARRTTEDGGGFGANVDSYGPEAPRDRCEGQCWCPGVRAYCWRVWWFSWAISPLVEWSVEFEKS